MPVYFKFFGDPALAQTYRGEGLGYLAQMKDRMALLKQETMTWNVNTPRAYFTVSSQILLDDAAGKNRFMDAGFHLLPAPSNSMSVDIVAISVRPKPPKGVYSPYMWVGVKVYWADRPGPEIRTLGIDYGADNSYDNDYHGEETGFYNFAGWTGDGNDEVQEPSETTANHMIGPAHFVVPSANVCVFEPGNDARIEMSCHILDQEYLDDYSEEFGAPQYYIGVTDIPDKFVNEGQLLALFKEGTWIYNNVSTSVESTGITTQTDFITQFRYFKPGGSPAPSYSWNTGVTLDEFMSENDLTLIAAGTYIYVEDIGQVVLLLEDLVANGTIDGNTFDQYDGDQPGCGVMAWKTKNGLYTISMPWDPHGGFDASDYKQGDDGKNLWNGFACLDPNDKKKTFTKAIPPFPGVMKDRLVDVRHATCLDFYMPPEVFSVLKDNGFPYPGWPTVGTGFRLGCVIRDMETNDGLSTKTWTRTKVDNPDLSFTLKTDTTEHYISDLTHTPRYFEESDLLYSEDHKVPGTVIPGFYTIKVGLGSGIYSQVLRDGWFLAGAFEMWSQTCLMYPYLKNETPIKCLLEIRLGQGDYIIYRKKINIDSIGFTDQNMLSYGGWNNNKEPHGNAFLPAEFHYKSDVELAISGSRAYDQFSSGGSFQATDGLTGACPAGSNWHPDAWLVDVANGVIIGETATAPAISQIADFVPEALFDEDEVSQFDEYGVYYTESVLAGQSTPTDNPSTYLTINDIDETDY